MNKLGLEVIIEIYVCLLERNNNFSIHLEDNELVLFSRKYNQPWVLNGGVWVRRKSEMYRHLLQVGIKK